MKNTQYTIQWTSSDKQQFSSLDDYAYFTTIQEAQQDIIDIPIIEDAEYHILEVNTDNGDVISSYSVIGGKNFWNQTDTTEEIVAYIEALKHDNSL